MSKIEWTHRPGTKSKVLNPTTSCDKISRGCKFCYAEVMHKRLRGMGQPKYQQPFLGHVKYWPDELAKPFKWKKPCTVFLNSMSDIFHEDVQMQDIAEIYAMMFLTPQHTYIVLTKRAERACKLLNGDEFFEYYHRACNRLHDKYIGALEQAMYFEEELRSMWPLKNVWQGISAEDQPNLDERGPWLLLTPAHIRVISYEPALGQINLFPYFYNQFRYCDSCKKIVKTRPIGVGEEFEGHLCVENELVCESFTSCVDSNINWIISGAESGSKARPYHPNWFSSVRDQCAEAGVTYFHKQNGCWMPSGASPSSTDGKFTRVSELGEYRITYLKDAINDVLSFGGALMKKVKKSESGNLLDGVQHLEFPA